MNGWTDATDCFTYAGNEVGKYLRAMSDKFLVNGGQVDVLRGGENAR